MIFIWIVICILIIILYNISLHKWFDNRGIDYFLPYIIGLLGGNSIIISSLIAIYIKFFK